MCIHGSIRISSLLFFRTSIQYRFKYEFHRSAKLDMRESQNAVRSSRIVPMILLSTHSMQF